MYSLQYCNIIFTDLLIIYYIIYDMNFYSCIQKETESPHFLQYITSLVLIVNIAENKSDINLLKLTECRYIYINY